MRQLTDEEEKENRMEKKDQKNSMKMNFSICYKDPNQLEYKSEFHS